MRMAIRHGFLFDGIDSRDYDVWITNVRVDDAPERDTTFLTIPGRNGEIAENQHRFMNVDAVYSVAVCKDVYQNFCGLKMALLSRSGYRRLRDTVHPEVFRMAMIRNKISVDVRKDNGPAEFDIVFSCKPQHFLITGETPQVLSHPSVLRNSGMPSLPLITVCGAGDGTVTIGGVTVQLFSMIDTVTLDCELQDAYRDRGGILENWNGKIYAPEFPVLQPGENRISWTGGVTQVEIIPRWWTL